MGTLSNEQNVLDLVGRIYDAALEPDLWPATLTETADMLGAMGGVFFMHDDAAKVIDLGYLGRLDKSMLSLYQDHYVECDFALAAALRNTPGRTIQNCAVSAAELQQSEFYNGFWRDFGIEHNIASVLLNDANRVLVTGFYRSAGAGDFTSENLRLFDILKPHLRRAAQCFRQFSFLESQSKAAIAALDHLPMGLILVDAAGGVLAMNRGAQEIVACNDGLRSLDGGLAAANRTESEALRGLIAAAARTGQGRGLHPGGAMALSRPSMLRPLSVLVAPIGREVWANGLDLGGERAAAVVFISDPEARQETPAELLRRFYGLTPAEARLAEAMAEGGPLSEAAERLGIGRETARSHLKQVFAKTGTHRQAELVRLLLTSPAAIKR
jgi:DNA-binding CsgD family transcriptional regulator